MWPARAGVTNVASHRTTGPEACDPSVHSDRFTRSPTALEVLRRVTECYLLCMFHFRDVQVPYVLEASASAVSVLQQRIGAGCLGLARVTPE